MPRIKGLYNTGKKVRVPPCYFTDCENLRMSWNKYNLYNLRHKDAANSRLLDHDIGDRKLYWQMQTGKRITRKYHGQVLQERVFKKQLYSPKFNVVAGGIGGERVIWGGLYQGIERRLDTVIFRSLFATSIQQARQMVIHGHVEVNGKKVLSTTKKLGADLPGISSGCTATTGRHLPRKSAARKTIYILSLPRQTQRIHRCPTRNENDLP
jgi:hypothetical protein